MITSPLFALFIILLAFFLLAKRMIFLLHGIMMHSQDSPVPIDAVLTLDLMIQARLNHSQIEIY